MKRKNGRKGKGKGKRDEEDGAGMGMGTQIHRMIGKLETREREEGGGLVVEWPKGRSRYDRERMKADGREDEDAAVSWMYSEIVSRC